MNFVHGEWNKTPEWRAWDKMLERCLRPSCAAFAHYGGRGITVCARWRSYVAFLEDMGRRPSARHSLGRIDNDGPYSPENCAWQTQQEQMRNTRRCHFITFAGETLTVTEWAERIGVNRSVLYGRLSSGWAIERVLTKPGRTV